MGNVLCNAGLSYFCSCGDANCSAGEKCQNKICTQITNAPTTNAPTTNAPTTNAPTTNAPTTNAPIANAPTNNALTTNALITNAPTTNAPTTNAPITTETHECDDVTNMCPSGQKCEARPRTSKKVCQDVAVLKTCDPSCGQNEVCTQKQTRSGIGYHCTPTGPARGVSGVNTVAQPVESGTGVTPRSEKIAETAPTTIETNECNPSCASGQVCKEMYTRMSGYQYYCTPTGPARGVSGVNTVAQPVESGTGVTPGSEKITETGSGVKREQDNPNCVDLNVTCAVWQLLGECNGASAEYVRKNCAKSCGTCK